FLFLGWRSSSCWLSGSWLLLLWLRLLCCCWLLVRVYTQFLEHQVVDAATFRTFQNSLLTQDIKVTVLFGYIFNGVLDLYKHWLDQGLLFFTDRHLSIVLELLDRLLQVHQFTLFVFAYHFVHG